MFYGVIIKPYPLPNNRHENGKRSYNTYQR